MFSMRSRSPPEGVNSDQLMAQTIQKKKKSRKKLIGQTKLLINNVAGQINKDPFYDPKNEQHVLKNRKLSFLKKRKNYKNTSTLISNTANSANFDCKEISTVSKIQKAQKHIIGEAVSLKDVKRVRKSKKNIINQSNKSSNESRDIKIADTECKKMLKRLHSSDASSLKNFQRKNVKLPDERSTNRFKNENDDKKNFVLRKTETENSSESDSNEDEILRNELQGFSVFKNIQKLIKNNPSLFASNFNEEESSEIKGLSESELEESPNESVDSGDDSFIKESEILPNSNKKVNVLKKSFENTEFFNKGKVIASTSSCDFNRTKKTSNISAKSFEDTEYFNKGKVVASTSLCDFNRTQKSSLTSKDEKAVPAKNKALEKLQGAKFRYLNEKLYTESGKDSFAYFKKNKDEYMDYHRGYSLQVAKWPLNPVEKIISSLQKMKKNLTIADMGCGDAKIARTLSGSCTVHSYDLVALNDFVISCNISKVPLSNESVDVVVFCLSLMGTNLKEYLQEAYRITKFGGILKIAEVESRIPDLDQFIKSIHSIGFSLQKKDVKHKLFVFLDFEKVKKKKNGAKLLDITLKPCFYKKR